MLKITKKMAEVHGNRTYLELSNIGIGQLTGSIDNNY
jgi:hypothetical protein